MNLKNNISKNIFREYDLRGLYGTEIDTDTAYTIGRSFGTYIKKFNETKTIVGYDNRHSSPELSNALIKGLTESGMDVITLGLVTTPMYYYAKKKYQINTGIMVTASHNPKEYNGFKISFSSIGNSYGKLITDFRDFTESLNFDEGNGKIEERNIKEDYIDLLCNNITLNKKIKVVVDCGNGTGSVIIKDILDKLNIEYYPLYCESDGDFPNHHPDPAVKDNMKDLSKKVIELNYDFGFAIDGDADRVGIVDELGNIISADLYMLIMYRYLNKSLKTRKALFDVKCSRTLIDELKKLEIEPIMYRTGASYANMKMQEDNIDFGGEYSGHLFFRDKFLGFDDGIYAGLRMLEILSNSNKKLSNLLDNINHYYSTDEIKATVTDENKFNIVNKIKEYCLNKGYKVVDIDGVRVEFEDSWALVRASNTGPNLTGRFEAKTKERLNEIEKEFKDLITRFSENG
ncbi:MAG: phosphomannomutase/phosphoglucomutase [Bacilli bacterium]|nr:phosphomannomutase/phosphoglucomutase [Bacilli bacterium]MBP3920047.1 phosphomannomutase/phosphoglucomutase [Bacilli bacterium]